MVGGIVGLVSGGAILFVTCIGAKRAWKEWLIVFTMTLAWPTLLFLAWFAASLSLRYVFSAFFVAFFVGVFNFVLYFEKLSSQDKPRCELAHERYLEYARISAWAVLFALVAYVAWELQALGPGRPAPDSGWPVGVLGLLQLVCVFGAGGLLVFWAFHRKLCQIEELMR